MDITKGPGRKQLYNACVVYIVHCIEQERRLHIHVPNPPETAMHVTSRITCHNRQMLGFFWKIANPLYVLHLLKKYRLYTILLTLKTRLMFKNFSNILPSYGIKILYLLIFFIFIFLIQGNSDFKFSCYIFPHEK